jgi:hypothetical protein
MSYKKPFRMNSLQNFRMNLKVLRSNTSELTVFDILVTKFTYFSLTIVPTQVLSTNKSFRLSSSERAHVRRLDHTAETANAVFERNTWSSST